MMLDQSKSNFRDGNRPTAMYSILVPFCLEDVVDEERLGGICVKREVVAAPEYEDGVDVTWRLTHEPVNKQEVASDAAPQGTGVVLQVSPGDTSKPTSPVRPTNVDSGMVVTREFGEKMMRQQFKGIQLLPEGQTVIVPKGGLESIAPPGFGDLAFMHIPHELRMARLPGRKRGYNYSAIGSLDAVGGINHGSVSRQVLTWLLEEQFGPFVYTRVVDAET